MGNSKIQNKTVCALQPLLNDQREREQCSADKDELGRCARLDGSWKITTKNHNVDGKMKAELREEIYLISTDRTKKKLFQNHFYRAQVRS